MRIVDDELVMEDGTRYYANNGIVGIDGELRMFEGYDGGLGDVTDAHRREIAVHMIERWTRVRDG